MISFCTPKYIFFPYFLECLYILLIFELYVQLEGSTLYNSAKNKLVLSVPENTRGIAVGQGTPGYESRQCSTWSGTIARETCVCSYRDKNAFQEALGAVQQHGKHMYTGTEIIGPGVRRLLLDSRTHSDRCERAQRQHAN